MKIDEALVKNLATIAATNEILGGVAPIQVKLNQYKKGAEIVVKTTSLAGESYRLEVNNEKLVLYISYGLGTMNAQEHLEKPTAVRVLPIPENVNKEEIDAVFDNGSLHIYLPFQEGKTDYRQQIPIRTKYNL